MTGSATRWNHNIAYHRLILDAVPAGARTALDVGTGDGLLAADLRHLVPQVTGLDADGAVLARAAAEHGGITWVQGDVMTHPFQLGSFDVVASVATLHHLPNLDSALTRLAELVSPGGLLAVVGLARSSGPVDVLHDAAGAVAHQILKRRRGFWDHSAPTVWPPPHTFYEVRRRAERALPGAEWRRLLLFRYSLLWRKPLASG